MTSHRPQATHNLPLSYSYYPDQPITMKAILLTVSALFLAVLSVNAAIPTSFIDLHLITSDTDSGGSLEKGYLFRVPASGANFGSKPPKAPGKWVDNKALTGGASSTEANQINGVTSNVKSSSSHPAHRLSLPPSSDEFLCNEALGTADYENPSGNSASNVFDSDTLLSGYEGGYILVPRGHCTFEAKARSAQRLGASGVIVRNTLDSRYSLIDKDADTAGEDFDYPDWGNTIWPREKNDYECGTNKAADNVGMRAEIKTDKLYFYPPPYGENNDLLLTGPAVDGNLCAKHMVGGEGMDTFETYCPSERCLLTGRNASDDGSKLEACCAWDKWITMSSDGDDDGDAVPQHREEKIKIPALFVTMENGDELYDIIKDAEKNSGGSSVQFVNVVPYARWYPSVHFSSIAVWVLTIITLWFASYKSAGEYRTSWKRISKAVNEGVLVFQRSATNANATGRERAETEDTVDLADENDLQVSPELEMTEQQQNGSTSNGVQNGEASPTNTPETDNQFTISSPNASFDADDADDFVGNGSAPATNGESDSSFAPVGAPRSNESSASNATTNNSTQQPQRVVNLQSSSVTSAMQTMDLNSYHAVLFVVFASAFLFILFFFDLYKIVRVIYGLVGSYAMIQVIIYPFMNLLSSKYLKEDMSKKLQSTAFGDLPGCRGVYFKWIDVISSVIGWTLGIAWIAVGFSTVQPMNNFYYWFLQDVIGVCVCVLVLSLIHINTIMVATILLVCVFIYDLFYVFISPYIFGNSIMIEVAQGGSNDPTLCEKYPDDSRCRGALAPLPMLLAMPWFNDFRGGFSMIGLGDIILPGLLISFAARYDASRELVRKCNQTSSIRSGENASFEVEGGASNESSSGGGGGRYHYHLGRVTKALFHGYFGPLMISYGIGLFIAYAMVWTMNQPQPALLYLVPCCLGTMLFLGWRKRELSELWNGPKIMKKANRMVGVSTRIPEARVAAQEEANVAETTSAV